MKRVKALVSLLLCAALMAPASSTAFAAADYTEQPQQAFQLTTLPSAATSVLQKVLTAPSAAQAKTSGETAESANGKRQREGGNPGGTGSGCSREAATADGLVHLELLP